MRVLHGLLSAASHKSFGTKSIHLHCSQWRRRRNFPDFHKNSKRTFASSLTAPNETDVQELFQRMNGRDGSILTHPSDMMEKYTKDWTVGIFLNDWLVVEVSSV